MDEIRETAEAIYFHWPEWRKKQVLAFFNSWDTDKDGKIDLQEYCRKLDNCSREVAENLFKELDFDGDDKLDYWEFLTLCYIIGSGRFLFCEECRVFLKGVYFTCSHCYNIDRASSVYLCRCCFRRNAFPPHEDANFVDNYTLLQSKKLQQAPIPKSHRVSKREEIKKWLKRVGGAMSKLTALAPVVVAIYQCSAGIM